MAEDKSRNYAFFQHKDCEFFPCHRGLDPEEFNCLFCYCPLYCLGESCGGDFRYTENGIKDCTKENYALVNDRFPEIREKARKKEPPES